jgi:5-methylcytosine-specific restriction endonuclease McrA
MAVEQYRRLTCADCGVEYLRPKQAGRLPKWCESCKLDRDSAPRQKYQKTCAQCGAQFVALVSWALRCSNKCNKAAFKEANPERAIRQHVEKKLREKERLHASEAFQRRQAGRELVRALRSLAVKRRDEDAERKAQAKCATCGKPVGRSYNDFPKKYCCRECREAGEVTQVVRRRSRSAYYAAKKTNTVERFDPIEVFERDGWRCQICGISTPKRLRGTTRPNAPELDHVVPISRNGAHARWNTQCACRGCNKAKSNKVVIGQIGLFSMLSEAQG